MIIFIYFNILLRFLINLFTIVFIGGKGSEDDISSDNENEDDDKTPTNERVSGDDLVTPNETINDITDLKHHLEQVKRVARGEEIDKKDLENIKEEYGAYFDEDSGNATEKESLNEIIEYIESELSLLLKKASLTGLKEALEEVYNKTSKTFSEGTESARNASEGLSTNREGVPETNTSKQTSNELTPLDYVLEKQSTDPLDFTDDQD